MKLLNSFVQISTVALLIYIIFFIIGHHLDWTAVWSYRRLFFKGWLVTIALSLFSLILSMIFGLIAALGNRSGIVIFSALTRLYIEIIRGTPLLVQILFLYYVVANSLGLDNRYLAGILILSLFHGAYIAELIRSGIEAISKTQIETSLAIGLTSFQTYRLIIFPQAIRQLIPPLAGQFASIIKDSSLLSVIGINELTNSAQQINSATYSTLETFLPLGLAYLILTLPLSLWSKSLEKKFQYEN